MKGEGLAYWPLAKILFGLLERHFCGMSWDGQRELRGWTLEGRLT
jgi:hypothetical protein